MPISITSVTGQGGSSPTSLLVSGTVTTCEKVVVTTSCSVAPVTVDIPTSTNVWSAVLPNDKQCPCGATVQVTASCAVAAKDSASESFTIVCPSPGSCFDNPDDVFALPTCLSSLSKDVRGETVLQASAHHICAKTKCVTLRTRGLLKVALAGHAPCDDPLAQTLSGSLLVQALATVYEADGHGRGIHAGDFKWTTAKGDEIDGRISGITNAGLVRAAPFSAAIEKCVAEGILVGRLCGRVVKTQNPDLKAAQVIATYRLLATPSAKGENGSVIGTLEGAVVSPC